MLPLETLDLAPQPTPSRKLAGDLSRAEKARKRRAETEKVAEARKAAKKKEAEQKKIEDTLKQIGKTFSGSDLIPILEENKFSTSIADHADGPYIHGAGAGSRQHHRSQRPEHPVFAAQFPMAQQAREKGRVQCSLRVTEAQTEKIREGFVSLKRPDKVEMFTGSEFDKSTGVDLSQIQLYGFLGNMVYCGPEYNSLATFRYTHKGERTVILMNFSTLWGLLSPEQQQFKLEPNYNITHYLQDLLSKTTSEDHLMKALVAAASNDKVKRVFKGNVGPKTLLYVPAGMVVIERCLNSSISMGLRVSARDSGACSMENLSGLHRIHAEYAPDSSMTKIWKVAGAQ